MLHQIVEQLVNTGFKDFFEDKPQNFNHLQLFKKQNAEDANRAFVFAEDGLEKELYLIYEYCLSEYDYKDELEKYEDKIKEIINQIQGFRILYRNQLLSYNLNLILICNFSTDDKFKSITDNFLAKYEKDKYTCRKIFINTSNDSKIKLPNTDNKEIYEELMVLPFIKINDKFAVGLETTLEEDLRSNISNDIEFDFIYSELGSSDVKKLKDETKNEYIRKIEQLILLKDNLDE